MVDWMDWLIRVPRGEDVGYGNFRGDEEAVDVLEGATVSWYKELL